MEAVPESRYITDAFSGTLMQGNRDHCQRPRSSRRLGIRRPSMRSLYLHTFALFCQGSRRCATHRHSAECRAGEKPHAIGRNHTRSLPHFLVKIDWVDVMSALNADPRKYNRSGTKAYRNGLKTPSVILSKYKENTRVHRDQQIQYFSNGYWGHPAYKLPPEVNLVALAHYLEALEVQRNRQKSKPFSEEKSPPQFLGRGYGLRRQHKRSQRPQHGTVELCRSNH